jgi:hypothetical protein
VGKVKKPPFGGIRRLTTFMAARERHRVAKISGRAVDKPDPIISQYRFCNVRRNDDRVTKWIFENYLEPWRADPELWFALTVARLFNNEDTLEDIREFVLPFRAGPMRRRLLRRAALGKKNFNAAYIVSTNGHAMNKVDYIIDHVLLPAWAERRSVSEVVGAADDLEEVHKTLLALNGLASFMAAQVVADLKYAAPERWSDFHDFVASGPGSRRGLNRVYGRDKDAPIAEETFRAELAAVSASVHAVLSKWEPITAQDLQNCLCEFDKWCRVFFEEGARPKQLYKPKENVK